MEQQGDYITQEEIEEGLDMLGKGYEDQPSVVVEPPRRRIERRGKQMMEVEEAAFVKFSTEFKSELADLDVYALKVFIYIGLSINFETGTAYPGIRKIAKETKMNKDTVAKAIEELEEKGFLQVRRKDGSSNIYKPECYFAIGETVPSGRTPPELSDGSAELSDENRQLSDASRVKESQPDKQDRTKKRGDLVDAFLFYGKQSQKDEPIEELLCKLERELRVNLQRSNSNQAIARKIIKADSEGKPLDAFLRWLKSDEWRLAHLYIYTDLAKLWQMYPQAFEVTKTAPTMPDMGDWEAMYG
jgi:hypothetical protein